MINEDFVMAREIKFRGKDVDTGGWIDGNLIQRKGYYPGIMYPHEENGKVYNRVCVVEPETVGQFTGLLDKNGKEIYEGDIYRYDNPDSINEVSYCAGGGFAGFDLTPAIHSENRLLDVEVIGNIHDNPELLKGGKE